MICGYCKEEVRPHERNCPACQFDCGFPNVRAAEAPEEAKELANRVAAAEREAKHNSAGGEVALFREDILKSRAVRARSLDEVYRLVKGDDQLTGTFHDLKGAGLLRPRDNEIEKARQSAEPLVFPNYHEKIVFAVLALDDNGLFQYGNCCMAFQENKIANRATVFEENCVLFCRKRNLGPGQPDVPPGFRAAWTNRGELAVAKLGNQLRPGMKEQDFAALLVPAGSAR